MGKDAGNMNRMNNSFTSRGKDRMEALKIKVCGMRDPENISGVVTAAPDFMGFIFYPKSKRFVGTQFSAEALKSIPESIKKVGVFVNELPEDAIEICWQLNLQVAQLHGNELPDYCRQVQRAGLIVFKAFSVDEQFDFEKLKSYYGTCSYFLFDTKGNVPGGTGRKFNWQLLEKYKGAVPFFLSGGIKPEDLEALRHFSHPRWRGIDLNSGFETEPAIKDIVKVKNFIFEIRNTKL
jgi:phosphoribosylanthranilate isomerase